MNGDAAHKALGYSEISENDGAAGLLAVRRLRVGLPLLDRQLTSSTPSSTNGRVFLIKKPYSSKIKGGLRLTKSNRAAVATRAAQHTLAPLHSVIKPFEEDSTRNFGGIGAFPRECLC